VSIDLGLSSVLIPTAKRADELGLHIVSFNSGAKKNPENGVRIFRGTYERDFFAGDHLAHYTTAGEVNAFLTGFSCA
jgi:hypothetical protein